MRMICPGGLFLLVMLVAGSAARADVLDSVDKPGRAAVCLMRTSLVDAMPEELDLSGASFRAAYATERLARAVPGQEYAAKFHEEGAAVEVAAFLFDAPAAAREALTRWQAEPPTPARTMAWVDVPAKVWGRRTDRFAARAAVDRWHFMVSVQSEEPKDEALARKVMARLLTEAAKCRLYTWPVHDAGGRDLELVLEMVYTNGNAVRLGPADPMLFSLRSAQEDTQIAFRVSLIQRSGPPVEAVDYTFRLSGLIAPLFKRVENGAEVPDHPLRGRGLAPVTVSFVLPKESYDKASAQLFDAPPGGGLLSLTTAARIVKPR